MVSGHASTVDVQGVSLGVGLDDGIDLTGTSGQISGVESSLFDGEYTVRMQSIVHGFQLRDSLIHSGSNGGVFAFMCEDIVLNNLTVFEPRVLISTKLQPNCTTSCSMVTILVLV